MYGYFNYYKVYLPMGYKGFGKGKTVEAAVSANAPAWVSSPNKDFKLITAGANNRPLRGNWQILAAAPDGSAVLLMHENVFGKEGTVGFGITEQSGVVCIPENAGRILAVFSTFRGAGYAIGPWFGAQFFEGMSSPVMLWGALSAFAAASLVCFVFLREKKPITVP